MKSFPSPLILRAWSAEELKAAKLRSQTYTLGAAFIYVSPQFGEITVPAGISTDFASIPRAVWAIISPEDPDILFGSVVHDYVYSVSGCLPERILTRRQADDLLREAMETCGAPAWKRWAVFQAVQRFGGTHWEK